MNFIKNFLREEDGVTAIEYALLAALIAVIILGAVRGLGQALMDTFNDIRDAVAEG